MFYGLSLGGCLCSMSVLLKSLFIIRNITPTYVQPCLALCFGEGPRFLEGFEVWGVTDDGDTDVGCAVTPG